MLVLVTGGRTYANADFVFSVLDRLAADPDIDQLAFIEGGAKGADSLALSWCQARCVDCVTMPADWKAYGRSAGFLRNRAMLDFGPPDLVVAFPGGPGTADMIRQAKAAGVRVICFADGEDQHAQDPCV